MYIYIYMCTPICVCICVRCLLPTNSPQVLCAFCCHFRAWSSADSTANHRAEDVIYENNWNEDADYMSASECSYVISKHVVTEKTCSLVASLD